MTPTSRSITLATALWALAGCSAADVASRAEIALTPGPRFGDTDGPGMVQARFANVACSSRGYFYTGFHRRDVAVFDSSGTFVRAIGRDGSGPGEFRQPGPMIVDGDTLYVIDRANGRYTTIAADGSITRIVPFTVVGAENPLSVAALGNGHVVVNGLHHHDGSDSLLPLHVADSTGSIAESFGDRTYNPIDLRRQNPPFRRALARAIDGGLWAAHVYEYRIDKWNADGRLERTLTVDAEWFPPVDAEPPRNRLSFGADMDVSARRWSFHRVAKVAVAEERPTPTGGISLDRPTTMPAAQTRRGATAHGTHTTSRRIHPCAASRTAFC